MDIFRKKISRKGAAGTKPWCRKAAGICYEASVTKTAPVRKKVVPWEL